MAEWCVRLGVEIWFYCLMPNWSEFFKEGVDSELVERICKHEQTGRPLGSKKFVLRLEKILDRMLRPKKAGRPKRDVKSEIN
jgi:putative transposase